MTDDKLKEKAYDLIKYDPKWRYLDSRHGCDPKGDEFKMLLAHLKDQRWPEDEPR